MQVGDKIRIVTSGSCYHQIGIISEVFSKPEIKDLIYRVEREGTYPLFLHEHEMELI